ncbi:MAG: serine/threonine protein kinase, partial [Methanobacteriota archaeon]
GTRVVALHPAFGSPIWSQGLPAPVTGNLALAGGALVFGAADGRVRALDTTTGAFLWVRSLGTLEPWLVSTPTRILAGAGTSMVALDPATGDV